jgi:hypothetical protein
MSLTEKYVSALAGGGGSGSSGSPWTLDEAVANVAAAGGGTRVNIKDDADYLRTASLTLITPGTQQNPIYWEGCHATPGDGGGPNLVAGASGINLFELAVSYNYVRNIHFDGVRSTYNTVRGIQQRNNTVNSVWNCFFKSFAYPAIDVWNNSLPIWYCRFTDCSALMTGDRGSLAFCVFHDNSASCLQEALLGDLHGCIFANNSGGSSDAVAWTTNDYGRIDRCTFYNNGRHAVNLNGGAWPARISNNVFVSNGGYGVTCAVARPDIRLQNNAFYGNGGVSNSGKYDTNITESFGEVLLTGNPFANPGGAINSMADAWANFAPNAVAGAGAALRAAGLVPYFDIGAVQHQDSGGSGSLRRLGYSGGI